MAHDQNPNQNPIQDLIRDLAEREASGNYRSRRVYDPASFALAFCSNDYLGLSRHPAVVDALAEGAARYGAGAGASHLVNGHLKPHHELEEALADWLGVEAVLLFSTGYMANLGVLAALGDRRTRVYEDRLNHASLIDAARLSRARVARYRHGDAAHAGMLLADGAFRGATPLIVTDGVFSMDGDLAPLPELERLAREHGAWLVVDEAHAFGVLGEEGRGSFDALGVAPGDQVVRVGTLGKAFGVMGAFVAGSRVVIETLIQRARTYIYTTALSPAVAAALLESLRLIRTESWRRTHVMNLVARFRAGVAHLGMPLADAATPIQPLIFGTSARALEAAARLRAHGILVPAIRPPTVPEGTARLRLTFSAAHSEADVDQLLRAVATLRDLVLPVHSAIGSSRGPRATDGAFADLP